MDRQEIEFTGSYNVDEGEIFCIQDFQIPNVIFTAIENPLNSPILNLNNETNRIKAIFTGTWRDNEKVICFQVFNSGKLLSRGFTLLNSGDTYKRLKEPGLVLQKKLTALYQNGKLLFNSYHCSKRFLDLSVYYKEATDADLDIFSGNELFEFEDIDSFKENADSIIRKKIALLQKNNVMDNLSITDIQSAAGEFNVKVAINNEKLTIPADRKKLKELIRFLDEDYVTTPLTQRKCLTNSKQYL